MLEELSNGDFIVPYCVYKKANERLSQKEKENIYIQLLLNIANAIESDLAIYFDKFGKKDFEDGWTPTDYEIYTVEQEPQVEPEHKKSKKAPEKKTQKPKGKTVILTIAAAVAVIAALIVIFKSFLPENNNKFSFFICSK